MATSSERAFQQQHQHFQLTSVARAVLLLQGIATNAPLSGVGASSTSIASSSSSFDGNPMLGAIAEAGEAFVVISEFLQSESGTSSSSTATSTTTSSVLRQACAAGVREEVDRHLRDLAIIETEATSAATATALNGNTSSSSSWTLRRVSVWCSANIRRLRALRHLVETCMGLDGPATATAVWACAQHGDDEVRRLASDVLASTLRPLAASCRGWLRCTDTSSSSSGGGGGDTGGGGGGGGTFTDSSDFFIVRNTAPSSSLTSTSMGTVTVRDAWRAYKIDSSRVCGFLPDSLVESIFRCGRTLRFIRDACHDEAWVAELAATLSSASSLSTNSASFSNSSSSSNSSYTNTSRSPHLVLEASLERDTQILSPIADCRLLYLLREKFNVLSHLAAVHRYILLTQGDFASSLVTVMAPELRKPAHLVASARHVMEGLLETATRASNAHLDDRAVLDRVSARCLPIPIATTTTSASAAGNNSIPSSSSSASSALSVVPLGWDIFTLTYEIDAPISSVIDANAHETLSKAFAFLWQLRRCEHEVTVAWSEQSRLHHATRKARGKEAVLTLLHRGLLLRADVMGFLTTLLAYVMYDVLAPAWMELHTGVVEDPRDFDGILFAYRRYLEAIRSGLFLPKTISGANAEGVVVVGVEGNVVAETTTARSSSSAVATDDASASGSQSLSSSISEVRECISRILKSTLHFVEVQRKYCIDIRKVLEEESQRKKQLRKQKLEGTAAEISGNGGAGKKNSSSNGGSGGGGNTVSGRRHGSAKPDYDAAILAEGENDNDDNDDDDDDILGSDDQNVDTLPPLFACAAKHAPGLDAAAATYRQAVADLFAMIATAPSVVADRLASLLARYDFSAVTSR